MLGWQMYFTLMNWQRVILKVLKLNGMPGSISQIFINQYIAGENMSIVSYYSHVWMLKTIPTVIAVTRLFLLSDVTLRD